MDRVRGALLRLSLFLFLKPGFLRDITMARPKKAAAKKATAKKTTSKKLPKPDDNNAEPPVYRLDQGESLPSPETDE